MAKPLTLCVLAGALGLGACGGTEQLSQRGASSDPAVTTSTVGGQAPAFEESDADAVLDYQLVDYHFEGPDEVEGHKIFFKAVNHGTEDHELEVLDPNGEPVGEVEAMPPDAEGSAALELEPGTYTLQCILETADGKVHRDLGMHMDLEVE
ncbi:MAG TPA: hypothetical protein VGL92_07050 [Acidimicrobiia bacterium]